MTCATCAQRIEKVLGRVDGVSEAAVNLASEKATVSFDPERVGPAGIAAAIEGAGYEVPVEHVRLAITGMTCATCAQRIEKVVGRVPGVVSASVNLAAERASVAVRPGVAVADLIGAIEGAGYGAARAPSDAAERAAEQAAEARRNRAELGRLGISAALTAPLVLPMLLAPFGVHWMLPGWAQLALATPVQLWIGGRFYRAGWAALRSGSASMDVLVALGTTAAYGLSIALWLRGAMDLYFESAATLITLVLLGKWMEGRAKRSATVALRTLSALEPPTARIVRDGQEIEVPVEAVGVGQELVVRPGEAFPVDGVVIDGESHADESLLTGESRPVGKKAGDAVVGGSINGLGLLRVRATHVGQDTALARIVALVERAQATKAPVQRLVDQVAAVFVPAVLAIALVTLGGWLLAGASVEQAVVTAVSVLVIACPCALGLATPTALTVGTGLAAARGILIRDAEALERAQGVQVVVFDKTGTLTEGRPSVRAVHPAPEVGEHELLRWMAAAESGSEHPLAEAVREAARARGLAVPSAGHVRAVPGRGIEAVVDGHDVRVGSARFLEEHGAPSILLPAEPGTALAATVDERYLGAVVVGDAIRSTAADAIRRLHDRGVDTVLLTGDNRAAAEAVGAAVGIGRVVAEVLPEDKAGAVAVLRSGGRVVAMVGDGVNDAPALAAADVGFAMGSGADAARATAAVTLVRPDPALVDDAIAISRATVRKIRQNLFWAFAYNVVGIPLAASGWLTPVLAGGAMAMSSVSVVTNALLLRRTVREG
jgi:Cu+-exporting ATPase